MNRDRGAGSGSASDGTEAAEIRAQEEVRTQEDQDGAGSGGKEGRSACAAGYPAPLVSQPACQLAANTTAVKTTSSNTISGPVDPPRLAAALAAHPVGWTVREQAFSPRVRTEATTTSPSGACLE